MTTQDIHDMIQQASTEPTPATILNILRILDAINSNLEACELSARRANNTASCLANGIIPD